MQVSFGQVSRLMNRRSRSGQSIVLVAFAFILLIAFVGIAVDVAMMFVRYNSLRRAVDSAAIAVAGQVREGVSFTTLNNVAQQYINLQGNAGLNPKSVLVETCETDVFNYVTEVHAKLPLSVGTWPTAGQQSAIYDLIKNLPSTGANAKTVSTWWTQLNALPGEAWPKSELCQLDPQKLVRVSAQLDSPTTFLSLIGWKDVMLVTSSVSQTAVLDVALVMDTSLSMAYDTLAAETDHTTYPCDTNGDGVPVPCTIAPGVNNNRSLWNFHTTTSSTPTLGGFATAYQLDGSGGLGLAPYNPASTKAALGLDDGGVAGNAGVPAIRSECSVSRYPIYTHEANYAWAGCCNDPILQSYPSGAPGNVSATVNNAIWAFSQNIDPNYWVADDPSFLHSVIQSGSGTTYTWPSGSLNVGQNIAKATLTSGAGDPFNYSSLSCEPFKQVRDAARHFLYRLDFTRGDRVALIDFNSAANWLTPPNNTSSPIMLDKDTAIRTLNFKAGVEVTHIFTNNPSYPDLGNQQSNFGCNAYYNNRNPNYTVVHNQNQIFRYFDSVQCGDTNTGGGIRLARIALTDTRWVRREAVWVIVLLSDGYPNRTNPYQVPGTTVDSTNIGGGNTVQLLTGIPPLPKQDNSSASYGDDMTRETDPNTGNPYTIDDYCTNHFPAADSVVYGRKPQLCDGWGPTPVNIDPVTGVATRGGSNQLTMGFCPRSTYCDPNSTNPAMLNYCVGSTWNSPYGPVTIPAQDYHPAWWTTTVPRYAWPGREHVQGNNCLTVDPYARHFCMNRGGVIGPNEGITNTSDPLYDSQAAQECDPRYDGIDFARDEADYAGLLTYVASTSGVGGPQSVPGNFISMFSILFRHSSGATQLGTDILGVNMMRYFADAGDNGIIDNGLQEWYREHRWLQPSVANGILSADAGADVPGGGAGPVYKPWTTGSSPAFGLTGSDPCAQYDYLNAGAPAEGSPAYEAAGTADCGQFFYATDITKVNKAFTIIAGKLFTRLSR